MSERRVCVCACVCARAGNRMLAAIGVLACGWVIGAVGCARDTARVWCCRVRRVRTERV